MGDISPSRHPQKKLSVRFVDTVTTHGKYFDGNGLFLRVTKAGTKQWVQRIVVNGKRREFGLGSPKLVSLQEVRSIAFDNRKLAHQGVDPIEYKNKQKSIPTFSILCDEVHLIHSAGWRNKKHSAQFKSTLETYAHPYFGKKPVNQVTASDILKCLEPIWLTKQETAKRLKQRISTIFKRAIAQGYRFDNPTLNIEQALPPQNKVVNHMRSLPYDQITECIKAIKISKAQYSTKLALEFLIHTACRSKEVRRACWSEIFIDDGKQLEKAEKVSWVIPAEEMKANREHRVPLSQHCIEILRHAHLNKSHGIDLIFPSIKGSMISDMTMSKLVKSLGYQVDVHGFRTTFKVWAQERTNFSREVSEMALAHCISNKSEAAYARSDLFEKRRRLMDQWSFFVLSQKSNVERIYA